MTTTATLMGGAQAPHVVGRLFGRQLSERRCHDRAPDRRALAVKQVEYSVSGIYCWTLLRLAWLALSWVGAMAALAAVLVANGEADPAGLRAGAPAILAGVLWVTASGKATALVDRPSYWSAGTLLLRTLVVFGSAEAVALGTAFWLAVASRTLVALLAGGAALAALMGMAGLLLTDGLWARVRTTRCPDRPLRALIDLGSHPDRMALEEAVCGVDDVRSAAVAVLAPSDWLASPPLATDLDILTDAATYREPAEQCGAAAVLLVHPSDLCSELRLYRELKQAGLQLWVRERVA